MSVCKNGHLDVLQFLLSLRHINVNVKNEVIKEIMEPKLDEYIF